MAVPRLTRAQLESTVTSLHGLRITGVEYALMTGSDIDEHEPLTWDYDAWHEPTHGCQLTTDNGVFTFTWGNTFDCYGLEVFELTVDKFIVNIGEPWGPTILSVGDHPQWRRLLGREIIDTELAWAEWDSGDSTPCWIRLDLAASGRHDDEPDSVWIAVGRWDRDRFLFATDDVTVIFNRREAARTGIMK